MEAEGDMCAQLYRAERDTRTRESGLMLTEERCVSDLRRAA